MKKIISIFIVLSMFLSGCARESTQQARSVCESYMEKMQELFSEGVVDPYEDDVLSELVTNSKLWDDLNS
jgi:PBP1b-binding outer membrane lipoprotein LpoB